MMNDPEEVAQAIFEIYARIEAAIMSYTHSRQNGLFFCKLVADLMWKE